jgi:hypothetical protein
LDFSVKLNTHVNLTTNRHWTLEGKYFNVSTGNYAVPLINYYLHTTKAHIGFLHSHTNNQTYTPNHKHNIINNARTTETYPAGISPGSSKQQIMQRIPTNCTCFILHYDAGGYGHAKTIKLYEGEWWNMDSETTGPTILTSPDWHQMQGHIFTLTHTTPQFHGHLFQPEIYYNPTNQTGEDPIYLVSEDEDPTNYTTNNNTLQTPTPNKKRTPEDKPHSPQDSKPHNHNKTNIPDSNKLKQRRIFGAGPPAKKPTPPRTIKPTTKPKRKKTEHNTTHPTHQHQSRSQTTNITTINCRGIGSSWEIIYDHIRTNNNDIIILPVSI